MANIEDKLKTVAFKLRKIRELKGLTREQFCEPLGENSDYWGLIERGEQTLSLPKLISVCETYHIPIEDVVDLDFAQQDDANLRAELHAIVDTCNRKQLELIKKFAEDFSSIL